MNIKVSLPNIFRVLSLIMSITLIGCTDDSLEKENIQLKKQINDLKTDSEECRYGPQRLLEEAKLLYSDSLFEKAKDKLEYIIKNHFGSPQTIDAKILIAVINDAIEKQKEEKKLAEERAEEEKEKQIALATKNMYKKYNEYTQITWYQDLSSPRYVNRNGFFLEFGTFKSGGVTPLKLNIQYYAEDWLFIESYKLVVDDKTYTIIPDDVETDSGEGGKIWEWYSASLDSYTYELVKAISDSKVAKIRFNGKQYYDERTITSQEKKALKNVLILYEGLGSNINF